MEIQGGPINWQAIKYLWANATAEPDVGLIPLLYCNEPTLFEVE